LVNDITAEVETSPGYFTGFATNRALTLGMV